MRGRGSKRHTKPRMGPGLLSPPVRGRGSKRVMAAAVEGRDRRPPCGGRGSKPRREQQDQAERAGRPPCGGVDRNTSDGDTFVFTRLSPPVRGRGSKLPQHDQLRRYDGRPPCGGVDRNAINPSTGAVSGGRPPCGGVDRNTLFGFGALATGGRPPCGGVDRNAALAGSAATGSVAPRAGAWIETFSRTRSLPTVRTSPPVRGRGSKPDRRHAF